MLTIVVPRNDDIWDESKQMFITNPGATLQLEHSLVSLSKWESKWHKPFFPKYENDPKDVKTPEETIDYIRCMTINKNVDPIVYEFLTPENVADINAYIRDPMTATKIDEGPEVSNKKINGEFITSELIYYWMIALNIPVEFEKWHIERLLTLIRVCNIKNQPEKKMSRAEIMEQHRAINEARRREARLRAQKR